MTMKINKKTKSAFAVTMEPERPLTFSKINFYDSMRFFLIMAQFWGVMPLHRLGNDYYKVHFKWKSVRVFYALSNAVGALVSGLFWIVKFTKDGLYVDKTANLCFYMCTAIGSFLLIELARHWSQVMKEWSYVEMSMRSYKKPMNLRRKFICFTSTFLMIGIVEHILFIVNGIQSAQRCQNLSGDLFKGFFLISFENYFSIIDYSPWSAILVKFFNTISTFTWIFVDLLISLASIALTARFQQIVRRLKDNKVKHEKFWKEIRQDYQRLYRLSQVMQKRLSAIVLVSYIQNIYFLCIQLYNSLRDRSGVLESVYFFYSFGFLVLRILAVSLYGAQLHDEARKPLEYLHTVPTENYCTEVRLLIDQICNTPVGLTGSGFFVITKNFLLQIAGTIVTFELMIFQFAPVTNRPSDGYCFETGN